MKCFKKTFYKKRFSQLDAESNKCMLLISRLVKFINASDCFRTSLISHGYAPSINWETTLCETTWVSRCHRNRKEKNSKRALRKWRNSPFQNHVIGTTYHASIEISADNSKADEKLYREHGYKWRPASYEKKLPTWRRVNRTTCEECVEEDYEPAESIASSDNQAASFPSASYFRDAICMSRSQAIKQLMKDVLKWTSGSQEPRRSFLAFPLASLTCASFNRLSLKLHIMGF